MWYSFPFTPSLGLHIAVFRVPLHFEPSGHRFPNNSPPNLYTHFIEGSLIACRTSSPSSVSPQNCAVLISVSPLINSHNAVFRVSFNFEPSGHQFPPNSPPTLYTHFIGGSPLSMSDLIPVVWFIPKPCGTHFLLPHHLGLHIAVFRVPLHFEPSGH